MLPNDTMERPVMETNQSISTRHRQRRRVRHVVMLAVVCAGVAFGWRVLKPSRSTSEFPVEIHYDHIVTQPKVTIGSAVLIIAPDGNVWAWGDNKVGATDEAGLLGPPSVRGQWHTPRRLEVGSNWIALAAGYTDAIGIKADGSLWGWTFNPTSSHFSFGLCTNPPAPVAPGTNWVAVAAGGSHALALRGDGTLWACGQNQHGQVGDGEPIHRGPSPRRPSTVRILTQVGTNQNWVAIAADTAYSSLGLQSDGSLWQWGQMQVSGIGPASEINLSLPTRVDDETDWTAIAAGDFCFLGRKRDGSLWAWGANARSLGCFSQTTPSRVSTNITWSAMAMGRGHLVALRPDATLWESGITYSEAGGLNRIKESTVPAVIGQRNDWVDVWAKGWMSFGLTKDNTLWTWGFRPDDPREGSETMENISLWLRQHRLPSPVYVRRPAGSATPWPLVRFATNAIEPAAERSTAVSRINNPSKAHRL